MALGMFGWLGVTTHDAEFLPYLCCDEYCLLKLLRHRLFESNAEADEADSDIPRHGRSVGYGGGGVESLCKQVWHEIEG